MQILKVLCLLLVLNPAYSANLKPLVDAHWLIENLGQDSLLVLDIQPSAQYRQYHVPGAINAPYDGWRTGKKTPPKGMLPPLDQLEKKLGALGVGPDKQVVVVATGQGAGDLAAAARVLWTIKLMGHEDVAILNGGLIAYHEAKGRLEKGDNKPRPVSFASAPNKALLAELKDVQAALKNKTPLVDTRSVAEYLGIYQASPEQKAGTIPGAKNLPHDWLTVNGSAQLNKTENLKKLFTMQGIATDQGNIHFCQSGNRAALNWFVDYAVFGNKRARLYDGSSDEWGRRQDLQTEHQADIW